MRKGPDAGFNRPPPLRLASFVLTSLGGLLVGLGSLMNWATVGVNIANATGNALDSDVPGIDLAWGKITLVLGLFLLIGGVLMRAIVSKRTAGSIGWSVVVASVAATAIAVLNVVTKDSAFTSGAEDTAQRIANTTGLPFEDILARMERFQAVDLKLGIYLVIVGGVIGLIGGLLGLAWVSRPDRAPEVADAPPPPDRSTPLPPPPEPGEGAQPPPD
jgi:hypothetical protein